MPAPYGAQAQEQEQSAKETAPGWIRPFTGARQAVETFSRNRRCLTYRLRRWAGRFHDFGQSPRSRQCNPPGLAHTDAQTWAISLMLSMRPSRRRLEIMPEGEINS